MCKRGPLPVFLGLLLIVSIGLSCAPSSADTPSKVAPQPPVAAQAPAAPPAPELPPDTIAHTVTKGQLLPHVVSRYLPQTKYMTGSELERAIRAANGDLKGIGLKPGSTLLIPGKLPEPFVVKPLGIKKDFEVRAIYLTGTMAASARGLEIVRRWREVGGNAVVFDIKDSDGIVNVPFEGKLSSYPTRRAVMRNLAKYVDWLHRQNMVAIARIAIFRDEYLVTKHPEVAIRSRATGEAWRENGKLVWTDPSRADVQQYNIDLARYAAEAGVDEVQYDYVRFPAEGNQKDALFAFQSGNPKWQRSDVINDFLDKSQKALHNSGALFSLDVFGVMGWQRNVDLAHTGQDIPQMARRCDVLSPMIYPSHFYGMDGHALPGDAPEHFIGASMDRFRAITKDTGVVLRPWLQAFGWKTRTYSPEYIRVQVKVSNAKGGIGFLFWNARNDYSKPYAAMPQMKDAAYMRGDEIGQAAKAGVQ